MAETFFFSVQVGKSPVVASSCRVVQTMLEKEFSDVVSCLMRIVWAAAAGNLQLAASSLPNPVASEQQSAGARFGFKILLGRADVTAPTKNLPRLSLVAEILL